MSYGFSRGAQQYQQTGALSASYADPHQQVQMLMDGALDRMAQAKGAIQRGEVAEKGALLGKAIAIIGGLQAGLDHGAGDIAANLDSLYDYMQRRLLHANIRSDVGAIDEISALLRELRTAWAAVPPEARGTAQQTEDGTQG
jgi:flagellar protein FliS